MGVMKEKMELQAAKSQMMTEKMEAMALKVEAVTKKMEEQATKSQAMTVKMEAMKAVVQSLTQSKDIARQNTKAGKHFTCSLSCYIVQLTCSDDIISCFLLVDQS